MFIRFLPKVLVCDQSTTNQSAYRMLKISQNNPKLVIRGIEIIAIFDTPHLIKSIRNNLVSGDFLLDGKK